VSPSSSIRSFSLTTSSSSNWCCSIYNNHCWFL